MVMFFSIDRVSQPKLQDPRITFLKGNALALGETLPDELIGSLGGPLLIVDDSAHLYEPTLAVLLFFHDHLSSGDFVVIEDGIVDDLPDARYRKYANGPNRAVRTFLEKHPSLYEIDDRYCDFFGYNYTFNPNGYIKRIADRDRGSEGH